MIHEDMFVSNFKADGAIGDGIAFAIVGDHENRPTDMTNLVILNGQEKGNVLQESPKSAEQG